jgi:sugar phosphate isomerase/epimerase
LIERIIAMKRALFSVSYAGLWGQAYLPLPEFITHAAELGYEGVLLMGKRPHLSVLDTTPQVRSELKRRLADSGVACVGVAAYTNFTANATSSEVPLNEVQLLYLQRLCELTADLGGRYVRVFTGYTTGIYTPNQEWQLCVAALRECGEIAQRFGLLIGVQNHHDIGVATRALQLLLAEVNHPAVRPSYDCWSPFLCGEDVYAGAKTMAPVMVNTICADYAVIPVFRYQPQQVDYEQMPTRFVRAVPMGTGDLAYSDFLRGLADGGYEGYVTYEMCSPIHGGGQLENLDGYARSFLSYLADFGH